MTESKDAITAALSVESEHVQLATAVPVSEQVENWLQSLLSGMQTTLQVCPACSAHANTCVSHTYMGLKMMLQVYHTLFTCPPCASSEKAGKVPTMMKALRSFVLLLFLWLPHQEHVVKGSLVLQRFASVDNGGRQCPTASQRQP